MDGVKAVRSPHKEVIQTFPRLLAAASNTSDYFLAFSWLPLSLPLPLSLLLPLSVMFWKYSWCLLWRAEFYILIPILPCYANMRPIRVPIQWQRGDIFWTVSVSCSRQAIWANRQERAMNKTTSRYISLRPSAGRFVWPAWSGRHPSHEQKVPPRRASDFWPIW